MGTSTRIASVAVLAVLACVAPCAAQSTASGASAGPIVSIDWLKQHFNDPGIAVIATNDTPPYESGHIPNARFVGHDGTLEHESHRLLAPEKLAAALASAGATDSTRIVLYGEPLAVGWLYYAFASLGHADRVSVLDGNYAAWLAAGNPASTDVPAPGTGRLTVKPSPDIAVDRTWVRSHLDDPKTRLLDVRSPREWEQGVIPNSTKFLWADLYSDVKTRRLKSPADMRAAFEKAGVGAGQTLVTYCAIGMRASLAYFAARAAGIPARVYVGSWADWSSDPTSPVSKQR
jgi:thiosulfate/3-mercaptopyruvate sulfurtransferase